MTRHQHGAEHLPQPGRQSDSFGHARSIRRAVAQIDRQNKPTLLEFAYQPFAGCSPRRVMLDRPGIGSCNEFPTLMAAIHVAPAQQAGLQQFQSTEKFNREIAQRYARPTRRSYRESRSQE